MVALYILFFAQSVVLKFAAVRADAGIINRARQVTNWLNIIRTPKRIHFLDSLV